MICRVCGATLAAPKYRSGGASSLTSMSTIVPHGTEVFVCEACGHIQTPPLGDLDAYYRSTYQLLADSEDEDQIYEVVDGVTVFRADHQADTLLAGAAIGEGARLLDFGSAKGATSRKLLARRPDLDLHLYDVTDRYRPHWASLAPLERTAVGAIPADWGSSFDVVASFFVLEHVEHPVDALRTIADLVRPGGLVHLVVPNTLTNVADFIVIDHVNHFTAPSLARVLAEAGFDEVVVDAEAHRGAWVARARRPVTGEPPAFDPTAWPVAPAVDAAADLAAYWSGARDAVGAAERRVGGRPMAVYGAGFYGAFVRSGLADPEAILAYVDQNPYLQGTMHFDRPVVAPADLPDAVTDVLVGLNPKVARDIIGAIPAFVDRDLTFHFL